jgi:AraC family transcriptional regulator, transcriptional activator of pobA
MRFQKIASLINVLYIDLARKYLSKELREKQNLYFLAKVKKLEDLIDQHFRKVKSPKEYARMMHMSKKQLNRICKLCLNKTTTDLIAYRIILEAKRMLVFTKESVSEIVAELGYTHNSYFFRFFKKKTLKTPVEFIKEFRKD